MQQLNREHICALRPERPDDGHKGTFGHVFVIGGSRGYSGAPILAGWGAMRSGAGLLTVGIPASLGDLPTMGLLEAMTFPLPETQQGTLAMAALESTTEFSADKDATVLGPGLSLHGKTQQYILEFIPLCRAPLLIDADGLNALVHGVDRLKQRSFDTVITPHPGEMARMLKVSTQDVLADRENLATSFAQKYGVTVVLKGHHTLIASPDGELVENTTGNNGMGTGGSGDVLSGLIGGLLAQGMSGFDAAKLGVYVHGLAGDIAAERFSARGMIARDIAQCIPDAWLALEQG